MNSCKNNRVLQPWNEKKKSNKHKKDEKIMTQKKIIDQCLQNVDDWYFSNYFRFKRKGRHRIFSRSYYDNPVRLKVSQISDCFRGIKKFSKIMTRPLAMAFYQREERNFVFEKKKFQKDFSGKTAEKKRNNKLKMENTEVASLMVLC